MKINRTSLGIVSMTCGVLLSASEVIFINATHTIFGVCLSIGLSFVLIFGGWTIYDESDD